MPELPEVETVVRHLKPELINKTIVDFQAIWPKVLDNISIKKFRNLILNQKIEDVFRRAKFIVLQLGNGWIPIHLRMTGKLIPKKEYSDEKHISAHFQFNDQYLIFKDERKFGRIYWYDNWQEFDQQHGLEPFHQEFTGSWLYKVFQLKQRQIKAALLDQKLIAGLGNIYVDEVLWCSRIHPRSKTNSLSKRKINLLQQAIIKTLQSAISYNGTTYINFSFKENVSGNYQDQLQVFDRKGMDCFRCNTPIIKIKVAGRGTYICPHCQK